jgi:hypothetical protein
MVQLVGSDTRTREVLGWQDVHVLYFMGSCYGGMTHSVEEAALSPPNGAIARAVRADQRTWNTSLPLKWRDSLTRCASAAWESR